MRNRSLQRALRPSGRAEFLASRYHICRRANRRRGGAAANTECMDSRPPWLESADVGDYQDLCSGQHAIPRRSSRSDFRNTQESLEAIRSGSFQGRDLCARGCSLLAGFRLRQAIRAAHDCASFRPVCRPPTFAQALCRVIGEIGIDRAFHLLLLVRPPSACGIVTSTRANAIAPCKEGLLRPRPGRIQCGKRCSTAPNCF
jgi:hypothetical protein